MSKPLRVAVVCEGPTDLIVLKAALDAMLPATEKIYSYLQPQMTPDLMPVETDKGYGWSGVYRWCKQAVAEGGGKISGALLFDNIDVLIVHMDADVAEKTYESGKIDDSTGDLPCAKPCPPPASTTNALRTVLLRWMNEPAVPPRTVFCTPSMNMEAWVIVALFPRTALLKKEGDKWECRAKPESQLGTQPKKQRINKTSEDYASRYDDFVAAWPRVCETQTEAKRFAAEFSVLLPSQAAVKTESAVNSI